MKCPYIDCGKETPDDLPFCDQCNRDINRCSNCGKITIAADLKCPDCGEETVPNEGPGGAAPAGEQQAAQSVPEPPAQGQGAPRTELAEMPGGGGSRIFLYHTEGWSMELADGDILGRVNGNHTDRLGSIKVISGTHAQITRDQDGWYITDQGSLNKTWVNGIQATPRQPMKFKKDDVVMLANVRFTVAEA